MKAKCIVNATGPYTDFVRKLDEPECPKICQPSSGIHIVLPDYYRYSMLNPCMGHFIHSVKRSSQCDQLLDCMTSRFFPFEI